MSVMHPSNPPEHTLRALGFPNRNCRKVMHVFAVFPGLAA